MQVICARDQLAEAFNLVSSITGQRSTNPITQNVLLTADKQGLELRATDLEQSLRRTLGEVETKKAGKALVPANLMAGLLKDIRSETVELKASGSTVELKAGRDRFELNTADPDEFPKLPEVADGASITLSGPAFNLAIKRVGRSIAQEKGRYALNGVLIEPRKNAVEFCGTDGRRLGYSKISAKGAEVNFQVIMPQKGYSLISKVIGNSEADIKIKLSENRLVASVNGTEVGTQLVEGQFPDYRSVIPKELDKQFVIGLEDFRLALNKARHLTSVESQAVRMEIAKGELTLRSKSPASGQAEVKVEIEYDGEDAVIGFDPQYILGGLDGFDDGKVTFLFKDKDTGAIMHAGEREKFYYLVMPIDI
ncbi:MAG: DNA polymerase III subunit beta [Planctomycetes bacterium]|nr:DNA polymerase III subunit beta [Planctomycetota bacterium]